MSACARSSAYRRMSKSTHPLDPAVEIAREFLLQGSKSPFASLAILASRRSGDKYSQVELAEQLGKRLCHAALARLHTKVFYDWLNTPLDDQKRAVEEHLREMARASAREVALDSFQRYIPASAEPPERRLFEADLSIILALAKAKQSDHLLASNSPNWRLSLVLQMARCSIGDRKLTLKRIGRTFRVSPNHLGRTFRDRAGMTFRKYLLLRRMIMAADVLRSQRPALRAVAKIFGYGSQSNFSRDFVRVHQRGPALYVSSGKC